MTGLIHSRTTTALARLPSAREGMDFYPEPCQRSAVAEGASTPQNLLTHVLIGTWLNHEALAAELVLPCSARTGPPY